MSLIQTLLIKRAQKKKPAFKRQDLARPRLADRWRQPKGMHSKLRRKFKSRGKHPSTGYGAPRAIYGFNPQGLLEVRVSTLQELMQIKHPQVALLSSTLGTKKREACH